MEEEVKFEVLHRERTDLGSYYGSLYSKDFTEGDILTWLGHDGVYGYLHGETFICLDEHLMEDIDYIPIYKKVGEYDIRGTIFPYDETLKSIMKRKPHERFKNWWKDFRYMLSKLNGEGFYS